MLFILLSLGGIVFYKIIYLKQTMKNKEMYIVNTNEGFQEQQNKGTLNDALISFTGGEYNDDTNNNEENKQEMINNLQNMVETLKTKVDTLTENRNDLGIFENSIDLENMEGINQQELIRLEREIDDLLTKTINNKKKEYKKIPVYNSCIIQEANNDKTVVPDHTHAITETKTFTDEEKNDIEQNIKNLQTYKDILTNIKPEIEKILQGTTVDITVD